MGVYCSLLEGLERRRVFVKMFADDLVRAAEDDDQLYTKSDSDTKHLVQRQLCDKISSAKTKTVEFRRSGAVEDCM